MGNNIKTVYITTSLEGLEILSCNDEHQFDKHLHDGTYVLWLNSESGEHFTLNGNSHVLQLGEVSIIEPGVIHSNYPCVPRQRHLRSFYFSESFLRNVKREISDVDSGPSLPTSILKNYRLWSAFIDLHEDLLHTEDRLSLDVKIISIFSYIYKQGDSSARPVFSSNTYKIDTIIDYFHENIDRQFSLDELAGLVHCSSYHLIRFFRRERGIAPHAFLIQLRLEKAKSLLDRGHPIIDAACLCGFSDQSHLTRKFKTRYGVTPGVYQKQKGLR